MKLDELIGQLRWVAEIKRKQATELLTLSHDAMEKRDDCRRSDLLQEQVKDLERAINILREATVPGILTTENTEHTEKAGA